MRRVADCCNVWHWMGVIRSVNEDEDGRVADKEFGEESQPVRSASSPVDVCHVQLSIGCDAPSPSSSGDVQSPSMPEVCISQDLARPSTSSKELNRADSLPKSDDIQSPSGLVAFCQSDTSAFSSFITAKHSNSPVVVPGCDERLRNSSSARTTSHGSTSCTAGSCDTDRQTSDSERDDAEQAPSDNGSPSSHREADSAQRSTASNEAAESPVSGSDAASYNDHSCPSPLAVDENSSEVHQTAVDDNSYVCAPSICSEGYVVSYPSYIPVPVPALPPPPPPLCYHSPMPGMMCACPPAAPVYMSPVPAPPPPCYSSSVSVIQSYRCPMYPVMPPPGMMPPVSPMMPMPYPPYHPSPYPAPYGVPPHMMYRQMYMPLPGPMPPPHPQWQMTDRCLMVHTTRSVNVVFYIALWSLFCRDVDFTAEC